jgi:anti-sigma factor RsiW
MNATGQEHDDMLSAYVDGELDAAAIAEVEQLLAQDPQARRTVETHRETSALLRAAFAEPLFNPGAERLLHTPPPRRTTPRSIATAIAASVLACIIGFGGGLLWSGHDGNPRMALLDEVTEYHQVFSRETTHLVEVPASQPDEIRRWLGHRIERRLDIPDLTQAGLAFSGARLQVVDGKPVATLYYTRDRGAPIALCLTQFEGAVEPLQVERRNGMRIASWFDGHFAYLLVGDLEAGMARALAELAAEQLRS